MGQETTEQNSASSVSGKKSPKRKQAFSSLYRSFKASGLGKIESAFSALYVCQTMRHTAKTLDTRDVGDGFFAHPSGWYVDKAEITRRTASSKALKLLEFSAKLLAPVTKSVEKVKRKDNTPFSHRTIKTVCALALTAVLALCTFTALRGDTVVEISIDGVVKGEVSDIEVFNTAFDKVIEKLSAIKGDAFSFPYEISFVVKDGDKKNALGEDDITALLMSYTKDYIKEGYGLFIDERLVAVLDAREDIEEVLENVKKEHKAITGEDETVANTIEIKYQEFSPDSFMTREELEEMFLPVIENAEDDIPKKTLLSSPTTHSSITISQNDPDLKEKLSNALDGAKDGEAALLDFEVYYEKTVRETIPYTIEYITDDDYYVSQETVKQAGRDGIAYNTYKIKYINGEEVSRELTEQNITRKPRTCIMRVGTRPLPEEMTEEENGGRYMINPCPESYISDHFGWRVLKGRRDKHEGLDLAAWVGTPIYAAASGEVVYAGYSTSYGYVLKVLHDDGLTSVYAHSSKLLKKLGDKVVQGEKIALVGSTGASYGYHLHFEVIKDGVKVDPENYIYSME